MEKTQQIKEIIEQQFVPVIKEEGFEIFEIKVFYSGGRLNIRVIIDYEFGGIKLDQCAALSRKMNFWIEENEILGEEAFMLEFGSPGIDRILHDLKDFLRIKGRRVLVWLDEKVNEKEYYEGMVLGTDEERSVLLIEVNGEELSIPLNIIRKGKEKIDF